jgi:hypothetical protein
MVRLIWKPVSIHHLSRTDTHILPLDDDKKGVGKAPFGAMSSFPRRRRAHWSSLLLLVLVWITGIATAGKDGSKKAADSRQCYFPSGLPSPGKPCHPDATQSVCCSPGFTCLSNGICEAGPANANERAWKYSLYRSGCTDSTFNDPACPQFCVGRMC